MLFQAYIGGRPAEFVYISKGKASQDPLSKAEVNKNDCPYKRRDEDAGLQYDDDSDTSHRLDYNDDIDCDDDDNEQDDTITSSDLSDRDTESADYDSDYISDETDTPITEGSDDCYTMKAGRLDEAGRQDCDTVDIDIFGEAIQKYKVLYYEDICLQVVRNLRKGERDILAIEVYLQHYKGVDNKPKLYISLRYLPKLMLTLYSTTFLF